MGFLKGNYLLKLVITSDLITQSKLLGGSTPQTPVGDASAVTERVEVPSPNPSRISFSVGCLQAAADIFVII
ncbi:hypothetical protein PN502_10385 [Microcystis aeruginosa CS-338/01]|uniref:hypothetical protein n=1 Tax=Microcystis aeruginosa TaxID=1126 RepID=UPI00232C119A|nr:hypothetical protein [Microcystis aeruginosa]MDB9507478.1 hypothetical protein [Microcystis aeruginosa CS-338/01]